MRISSSTTIGQGVRYFEVGGEEVQTSGLRILKTNLSTETPKFRSMFLFKKFP